jgi:hypothetical protein
MAGVLLFLLAGVVIYEKAEAGPPIPHKKISYYWGRNVDINSVQDSIMFFPPLDSVAVVGDNGVVVDGCAVMKYTGSSIDTVVFYGPEIPGDSLKIAVENETNVDVDVLTPIVYAKVRKIRIVSNSNPSDWIVWAWKF